MEHLLAPLHWANGSVYSESLKGCACELLAAGTHPMVTLAFVAMVSQAGGQVISAHPTHPTHSWRNAWVTAWTWQHGLRDLRMHRPIVHKPKNTPPPYPKACKNHLFMCWFCSFIDALWMIHELIHTVNKKRWNTPSKHRELSQIINHACANLCFAHKGFMDYLNKASLNSDAEVCWKLASNLRQNCLFFCVRLTFKGTLAWRNSWQNLPFRLLGKDFEGVSVSLFSLVLTVILC